MNAISGGVSPGGSGNAMACETEKSGYVGAEVVTRRRRVEGLARLCRMRSDL